MKGKIEIKIDQNAGFCFGVVAAIHRAEQELLNTNKLYCLGDIVHNNVEVERLSKKVLSVITYSDFEQLSDAKVFIRAHGEPPSSYAVVKKNNLRLTDATCPVVLKLQQRIRESWKRLSKIGGQVVLFGKKGHAEVIGLMGQTNNECVLIENESQIYLIDSSKPTEVFSQTTKDPEQYSYLIRKIEEHVNNTVEAHHTICRQMSDRAQRLQNFANSHDMIIFVGGAKSSNSKVLYEICKNINPNSYFVTNENEVSEDWFSTMPSSVGIFGATSTPLWLMENVKNKILNIH